MLSGVVKRFVVVWIGSSFQEYTAETDVVVESRGGVEARQRIVRQILGKKIGIGIGAVAQQNSCGLNQVRGAARPAVRVARETCVDERLAVLWTALGVGQRRRLSERPVYQFVVAQYEGHVKSGAGDLGVRGERLLRTFKIRCGSVDEGRNQFLKIQV